MSITSLFSTSKCFAEQPAAGPHANASLQSADIAAAPGLIVTKQIGSELVRTSLAADVELHPITSDVKAAAPSATQEESESRGRVTWQGMLQIQQPGWHHLHVYGRGAFNLKIDGQTVLQATSSDNQWLSAERVELSFGPHEFHLQCVGELSDCEVRVFWSGPGFEIEPIPARLYSHRPSDAPDQTLEMGRELAVGLRCAACHTFPAAEPMLPGPSLVRLQDNLRPSWLVAHLSQPGDDAADRILNRQMPYFALHRNSAAAVAAALFSKSETADKRAGETVADATRNPRGNAGQAKHEPDASQGKRLFASIGCVGCHRLDEMAISNEARDPRSIQRELFGGGELSKISTKRTAAFFQRWLDDPTHVNPAARMPKFEMTAAERRDLGAYLVTLGQDESAHDSQAWGDVALGSGIIAKHRCNACHTLPVGLASEFTKSPLTADSDWTGGCLQSAEPGQGIPGYRLRPEQINALKQFIGAPAGVRRESTSRRPEKDASDSDEPHNDVSEAGQRLMIEHNCLGCHRRDAEVGLDSRLPAIAELVPELAARLAALAPPSLTGVGDKLRKPALIEAITAANEPRRPWLDVRMPKFNLSPEEVATLSDYLIAHDRIPALPERLKRDEMTEELADVASGQQEPSIATDGFYEPHAAILAAGRLVTADGFGCQSCHQIGNTQPPKVDLKARGTDLAMIGERVRPEWFQRWVRNPARIVPRMEMPAIKFAAEGILNDSLDLQLDALWNVLNTPGFTPPEPNPIRIVRSHNQAGYEELPNVLTEVVETPTQIYLRPLVIGLPNRHNVLIDLERAHVTAWWLGDTAYQQTLGKSWFWQPAAPSLVGERALESFEVEDAEGNKWQPVPNEQFAIRLRSIRRNDSSVHWSGEVTLGREALRRTVAITQTVEPAPGGLRIGTTLEGLGQDEVVRVSLPGRSTDTPLAVSQQADSADASLSIPIYSAAAGHVAQLEINGQCRLTKPASPDDGQVQVLVQSMSTDGKFRHQWTSTYTAMLAADTFPLREPTFRPRKVQLLDVVPGFEAVELPLPRREMPISLAWDSSGRFYVGSLKGSVLQVVDRNGDGMHDDYEVIAANFPTPYGIQTNGEALDILVKFGLLRLTDRVGGQFRTATVLADDWGYTRDYHDWAVGLEKDPEGNYYMALPCQQDDRTAVAAHRRGTAIRLVPYEDSSGEPRYAAETLAAGLRFPMGIARNRDGALFATDNQGNYNPFNELNHLRSGKRYGFINKLENKEGFSPPFESPAINLPHPWTRSVNGICFLETPEGMTAPHFGPFEGQLLGCEMNNLALIRMSLQKVGDTYQGAAYPFSRTVSPEAATFEGPIVCEVAPDGDIYVGNLHDSGWGAGQNTGSIVRLRNAGQWPIGIAEVRATPAGFTIRFTGEVESSLASQAENYSIRSYRRIATPAYGGDDQDERTEQVVAVRLADDLRSVEVDLDDLRAGFVYEFNLGNLTPAGGEFFPSQAHYTLRMLVK